MTKEFTKEIYTQLLSAVAALPEEAVERAKKEITRKGYDTTGYQYQYLVNVLNDVIGPADWGFAYVIVKEKEGTRSTGKGYWEITVSVEITILGTKRICVGGHKADAHADALKGAITNGFKKTLAFFGVGKKAYEGTIDDDYLPEDDGNAIAHDVKKAFSKPMPQTNEPPFADAPPMDSGYRPIPHASELGVCKSCGAPNLMSKTKGKPYCSKKCWLT